MRNGILTTRLTIILFAGLTLTGCVAAVVGGAVIVHDRRSIGSVLDDGSIELTVKNNIYNEPAMGEDYHVKIVSNNGLVLLLGEVESERAKTRAAEIASSAEGVIRVENELGVMPPSSLGSRVDDTYMVAKINTILLTKNPMPGFDATRINVTVVRDVAYLMGLVTRQEGNDVAEVTRNVGGVEKVVKVFEYYD